MTPISFIDSRLSRACVILQSVQPLAPASLLPLGLPVFGALLAIAIVSPRALIAQSNYATPYAFTTLAGSGTEGSADGMGRAAQFSFPMGLAIDRAGNLYVADYNNDTIRKITPAGFVSTLARLPSRDGAAYGSFPYGVAVDASGNVFVSATTNNQIVKISPAGVVSPFAGNAARNPDLPAVTTWFGTKEPDPSNAGVTDGPAATARFHSPHGLALDSAGNLYVADSGNRSIRKITPAGTVTTLAGNPLYRYANVDGIGSAAFFGAINALAADDAGNVYVADFGLNTIRKVTAAGEVTTLAGKADTEGSTDGEAGAARFRNPQAIAVDSAGNLFLADTGNSTIRRITPSGTVTTLAGLAGTWQTWGRTDGIGRVARFAAPSGIAVDSSGTLYVADTSNDTIRQGVLAPPVLAPAIVAPPFSHLIPAGSTIALAVAATGTELLYQWRKDGADLPGATQPTLLLPAVAASAAGRYTVVARNDAGTVESAAATLTLTPPSSSPSRLANLSVRSRAGTGDRTLIAGFVVAGSEPKSVLLRGLGPALVRLGVSDALPDPQLRLFNAASTLIDHNDDWGGGSALATTFASLGAGALPAASCDAALLTSLSPGPYSLHVTATTGTGVALVEVYDADPPGTGSRLVNVSARSQVEVGDDVLIAGFVVAGPQSLTVLLRGLGPTLAQAGVAGALADPQLQLFDSSGRFLLKNDDWGGDRTLAEIFNTIGASALAATSKDSALLLTLPPGAYSALLSGVDATTGVALIEVYEVR